MITGPDGGAVQRQGGGAVQRRGGGAVQRQGGGGVQGRGGGAVQRRGGGAVQHRGGGAVQGRGGGAVQCRGGGAVQGRGGGRATGQGRRSQPVAQIPWQSVDTNSDATVNPLPFTEPVGPSSLLPVGSAPFDYYSQIIDRDVVDILVQETHK